MSCEVNSNVNWPLKTLKNTYKNYNLVGWLVKHVGQAIKDPKEHNLRGLGPCLKPCVFVKITLHEGLSSGGSHLDLTK